MGLVTSIFSNSWRLGASDLKGVEIPVGEITPAVATYGYRSIGIPTITCSTGYSFLAHLLAVESDANRASAETCTIMQAKSDATTKFYFGTGVRCSGSAGSEQGYVCYINEASGYLTISKIVAGTVTPVASYDFSASLTAVKQDFYVRFRANGTSLKARIWRYNQIEPTTWHLDYTDSSSPITGAGKIGLYSYCVTANNAGWSYPGFLSVATNGETAPIPLTDTQLGVWMNDDSQQRVMLAEVGLLGQTSGGASNPSFALMSTWPFVTRASEAPGSQVYDDVIVTPPVIRASAAEQFTGRTTLTYGDLIIKNEDGLRDHWLTWNWDGRSCELFLGGVGWRKWDFIRVLSGTVYEVYAPSSDKIGFKIRDNGAIINSEVRSAGSSTRDVIGGSDANAGAPKPFAFGACFNIEPVLKTASSLVYKWHDESVTSAQNGVAAVRDNGSLLTVTTNYTIQSTGEITLLATPAGRITMDVVNDESSSSAIKGGNQHRRMLQTLLEDRSPLGAGSVYLGARSGSVATFGPEVYAGLYVRGEANLLDILDQIVTSVGGFWYFNATGQFCAVVVSIPTSPYDHTLIEDDILDDLAIEKIILPSEAEQLGYQKNWTVQRDGLASGVSAANKALYGAEAQFTTLVPSYSGLDQPSNHQLRRTPKARVTLLRYSADAVTEATRLDAINRKTTAIVKFTTKFNTPLYDLGQSVFLTHSRYGFSTGKAGMIIGYEKDFDRNRTTIRMLVSYDGQFPVTSGTPAIVPSEEFY